MRVPEAVGVNVTLMKQLPLPEREVPQLLVWAKFPEMEMLVMDIRQPRISQRNGLRPARCTSELRAEGE